MSAYHHLRSALAETAREHWHVLSLITPAPPPRLVAAEAVATAATAYLQHPATWHVSAAIARTAAAATPKLGHAVRAEQITRADLLHLLQQLHLLDSATRAWTSSAYQPKPKEPETQ